MRAINNSTAYVACVVSLTKIIPSVRVAERLCSNYRNIYISYQTTNVAKDRTRYRSAITAVDEMTKEKTILRCLHQRILIPSFCDRNCTQNHTRYYGNVIHLGLFRGKIPYFSEEYVRKLGYILKQET